MKIKFSYGDRVRYIKGFWKGNQNDGIVTDPYPDINNCIMVYFDKTIPSDPECSFKANQDELGVVYDRFDAYLRVFI